MKDLLLEVIHEQPIDQWVEDIVGMIAIAIVCGAFVVLGLAVVPQ